MDQLLLWPPTWSTLLLIPVLFVGFTVHELGHAIVAYLLGDVGQVERRRLSFNPLRHVSWVGLVVFLLFGLGWAKPVQVDPRRFKVRNQAFGMLLVSLAGAAANLVTAVAVLGGMMATVFIVWVAGGASPLSVIEYLTLPGPDLDLQGIATALSGNMLMVNLVLAFFNLLPLPPLDGFQAVVSLVAAIRTARGRGTAPESAFWAIRQAAQVSRDTAGRETGVSLEGGEMATDGPALIHFGIGLDYHRAGQLEEAIARYRQATDNDDRFGLAYYNLGLAYWDKGRILQALSAFKAALACPGAVLQTQASRRIRELAPLQQSPDLRPGSAPPPLAPEDVQPKDVEARLQLDPAVRRRVLRSLAAGGIGAVLLAVVAWVYVTVVTWGALVGGLPLP